MSSFFKKNLAKFLYFIEILPENAYIDPQITRFKKLLIKKLLEIVLSGTMLLIASFWMCYFTRTHVPLILYPVLAVSYGFSYLVFEHVVKTILTKR